MKVLELLLMSLAKCVCVCVFLACLFALMKRFHLATVLVVRSVCLSVCVCKIPEHTVTVCLLPQSKSEQESEHEI